MDCIDTSGDVEDIAHFTTPDTREILWSRIVYEKKKNQFRISNTHFFLKSDDDDEFDGDDKFDAWYDSISTLVIGKCDG